MWVTTRVSPSTTRSSNSRRPPRSFLAPLASSARMLPMAAAGADQPLHLQVQILVLGLSAPRPWHSRTASSLYTPGWNT